MKLNESEMTVMPEQKANIKKKKERVKSDLTQRIDFTEFFRKNPKLRPKKRNKKAYK